MLAGNNQACYREREQLLRELEPEARQQPDLQRYAWTLERLLGRVSTPIEDDDVFLGRVVEAPWIFWWPSL